MTAVPPGPANRAAIDATICDRLRRCYEMPITGVNDSGMERELADRAMGRWIDTKSKSLSIPAQEKNTARLFNLAPLTNFRDIDNEPAQFQVWTVPGQQVEQHLRSDPPLWAPLPAPGWVVLAQSVGPQIQQPPWRTAAAPVAIGLLP